MRRSIPGNRTQLATIAVIGFLPFLLSSCDDTSSARECFEIPLGCFGDGRPDHGQYPQSCQASQYSYYNVHVLLDSSVDDVTRREIDSCRLQVANEAGTVLEDRALVKLSGAAACRAPETPYDIGTLDYSSCCGAGAQLDFGLVADGLDASPLAQGTVAATCAPGQIVSIDLVVRKI
jgi:hypothetical protein